MASRNAPLVIHVVHSLEGGGTERMLLSLLRAFDHRSMRHAVVTLRDAGSLAAQLPDEVACIALGAKGRSHGSAFRLAKICSRLRPSIIHARNVCTWPDAVMARMMSPGAKLILGFHGLQAGGHFSRRHSIAARIATILRARFTCVSEQGRQQMVQELRVPAGHIEHIPNGIELSHFAAQDSQLRARARESLGYSPHDCVVGIVGSLTPVKGHDVLFSAIAHAILSHSALRLLVVGDGPLRSSLETAARDLAIHDRVQFIGWRDDVPRLLSAMDAYLCASHSEGMSNAVLEAMAAGLPVISTAVGDHPAILRQGLDGLLVPPGDARALAEAIKTMLISPEFAVHIGRSARVRIQDFSIAQTVDAYQRFYHQAVFQHWQPQSHAFVAACRKVSSARNLLAWPRTLH